MGFIKRIVHCLFMSFCLTNIVYETNVDGDLKSITARCAKCGKLLALSYRIEDDEEIEHVSFLPVEKGKKYEQMDDYLKLKMQLFFANLKKG